jgi:putative toxin-antitoxin system antitoxin component (TIGR02293 family)
MGTRKSKNVHPEPISPPPVFGAFALAQVCRSFEDSVSEVSRVCDFFDGLFRKISGVQKESAWTAFDVITVTRQGLPRTSLNVLAQALEVEKINELDEILKISRRSLQRYVAEGKKELPKDLSDHILQVFKVYMRAIGVFEDQETAVRWLKAEIPALGRQVPLSLLDTSAGVDLVMAELGRIEYGVFA